MAMVSGTAQYRPQCRDHCQEPVISATETMQLRIAIARSPLRASLSEFISGVLVAAMDADGAALANQRSRHQAAEARTQLILFADIDIRRAARLDYWQQESRRPVAGSRAECIDPATGKTIRGK